MKRNSKQNKSLKSGNKIKSPSLEVIMNEEERKCSSTNMLMIQLRLTIQISFSFVKILLTLALKIKYFITLLHKFASTCIHSKLQAVRSTAITYIIRSQFPRDF